MFDMGHPHAGATDRAAAPGQHSPCGERSAAFSAGGACRAMLVGLLLHGLAAEAPAQDLRELSAIRDTIARWVEEGTAAGHEGDYYDNRDGGHSSIRMELFPGLKRVEYSKEERKRIGWGIQVRTLPHVTVGNSSTAGGRNYGSHARTCYTIPQLFGIAYLQYVGNNLYVYPEHHDHDVPVEGKGGYGDVLPSNSPYLLVSQGSSGSDKTYVRAALFTLAAFRPDVKELLAKRGLLMPTVQMVFRISNSHLEDEAEYLSGKAHPTVFQRDWANPRKMAETAHAMRVGEVPPMVQLQVVDEDLPVQGRDYFEARPRSEVLAGTRCVIARLFRGRQYQRRIVVSAEESYDLNDRPLEFHWVVLRGDPARVRIVPKNAQRSVVEIHAAYHPQTPTRWEPKIPSSRVDVGVFVHNGAYYSAPAFVTYYSLTNEKREYYDDGRAKEIDYAADRVFDERLTDHKPWRDVYEYSPAGEPTGWTRHYTRGQIEQYTPEGLLVLQKSAAGQPVRTAKVEYRMERSGGKMVLKPKAVPWGDVPAPADKLRQR